MIDLNYNYIILDFDGVCTKIGSGYDTVKPEVYGYDEECVSLIEKLCIETNSKIILSTNWRKFKDNGFWIYNGQKYFNPIPRLKKRLGELVFGIFPITHGISKSEAFEIYINNNNIDVNRFNFVVIDDDIDEGFSLNEHTKDRFILTAHYYGFTKYDYNRACEILKNNHS